MRIFRFPNEGAERTFVSGYEFIRRSTALGSKRLTFSPQVIV
jgi:hypothetical protein